MIRARMPMDEIYYRAISSALGLLTAFIGWFSLHIFNKTEKNEDAILALRNDHDHVIAKLRLHVSEDYVKRAELERTLTEFKEELTDIRKENKESYALIMGKIDKILDRMING